MAPRKKLITLEDYQRAPVSTAVKSMVDKDMMIIEKYKANTWRGTMHGSSLPFTDDDMAGISRDVIYSPDEKNVIEEHSTQLSQISNAMTGMDLLFNLQKEVEQSWGRLPNPNDPEHVSTYIREVVLCATDELHEVLAEVHWKPWKQQRGIKNRDNYREELADVLHFIIDLYLAAGLTSKEMVEDYMSKHNTNMVRSQSEEYKQS